MTMSRNLTPQEYQRMIALHKVIKKMSASEFVQWANRYYELAYNDGRDSTYKEIADNKDSIIVPDYVEAEVYEENEVINMEQLMDILLSVNGIGIKRANKVLDVIDNYFNRGDK